ncbi:TRAP transporter large permease [Chloroflexota bacterium]
MTIAGLVTLLVLALVGVPLYLAIGVCVIIMVAGLGLDTQIPVILMFERIGSISLLAVPLFILAGQLLAVGGSARPLVRLINAFMGHIPGGPAYALIIANVMVSAMCASSLAGVMAFGPVMIPMLRSLGYSEKFSYGLLICSATLEPLIPPSVITIMYSFLTGSAAGVPHVPVLTLWTGSIIPGLIIAALLAVTVYIHSRRGHFDRLPRASWNERWLALKDGWSIALMPVFVIGPLYIGWCTPTETAAIALVYVLLISIFIYRGLTLKGFWQACTTSMQVLAQVFVILMGAILLLWVFTYDRIPMELSEWVADLGLNWWAFMVALIFCYILMGMFLDPSAILLTTVPILLSSVNDLGISLIMYGIFTTLCVNLANITPPYGMLIFATMGILNKPYGFMVRSILMFIPAVALGLILVAFFPQLCTWLPAVTGR